jgi:magnesium-transporting ATPase (P-type)
MKRYWLSILILVAGIVFLVVIAGQSLLPLLDLPSFIITVVTPFLFVNILFGFKETRRAFAVIRKNGNEHDLLTNTLVFFRVYSKATWLSAIIGAFAGGIGMMANWEDRTSVGPNVALTLLTLFYCGFVQLAIVIPYTILINKQLRNNRIRGDLFSIFGSLFGVCFALLLLFTMYVPDFLQLPELESNQVNPLDLFNGIKDNADIEGYSMLEYELYNKLGNESSDFRAFIRCYSQMQMEEKTVI